MFTNSHTHIHTQTHTQSHRTTHKTLLWFCCVRKGVTCWTFNATNAKEKLGCAFNKKMPFRYLTYIFFTYWQVQENITQTSNAIWRKICSRSAFIIVHRDFMWRKWLNNLILLNEILSLHFMISKISFTDLKFNLSIPTFNFLSISSCKRNYIISELLFHIQVYIWTKR